MYKGLKVAIVIPALDEADSIARVIGDIPPSIDEIIVVDNGSMDDTKAKAQQAGARVLEEARPGYGSACLTGIRYLEGLAQNDQPDVLVILDGDYSDYPEQVTRLLDPIAANEQDFVLGSRVLGHCEQGALTPQQYWGNNLAVTLMHWFFGVKFTDMGPFRAIRFDAIKAMNMQDPNFGWNVEMQVKAIRRGLRILEVPVDYRNRIGHSKISGTIMGALGAGTKIIGTILYYVFKQ